MARVEITRDGTYVTVTIANGATVSSAVNTIGRAVHGVSLPAAFTGTAISFQTSADGTTYQGLYDAAGSLISVTVTQARNYAIPSSIEAWPYFKVVSNAAEGGARTIQIAMRG